MSLSEAFEGQKLLIGRKDPKTFTTLIKCIVSALAYLHTKLNGLPVVHRDLKPENIMVLISRGSDPVAKLIDFGLAKETMSGVGSTMGVKGTIPWMAPEQQQHGGCSTASDMYAYGLILYWMYYGKLLSGTPQINTERVTGDGLLNLALELMVKCLNPNPKLRPHAAVVSFQLENPTINQQDSTPESASAPFAAASSGSSKTSGNDFNVVDNVVVVGLQAKPEYNGRTALVSAYQEGTQRYVIRMQDNGAELALKRKNLNKSSTPTAAAA